MEIVPRAVTSLMAHFKDGFVIKPGEHLPPGLARSYTVAEHVGGQPLIDRYLTTTNGVLEPRTGQPLDMTPHVPGGIQPGDVVLRGQDPQFMFYTGLVSSVAQFFKTGKWHTERSAVSHAGRVASLDGQLRVIQMVGGSSPDEMQHFLQEEGQPRKWLDRKLKASYLFDTSIHDFFNPPGEAVVTDAVVMRPNDPAIAAEGSRNAAALRAAQQDGSHRWYNELFPALAPGHRGGNCADFVDWTAPVVKQAIATPLDFELSNGYRQVGEKRVLHEEVQRAQA